MHTHAIPAAVRLGLPLAATAMVLAACGNSGSSAATTTSSSTSSHAASMVKTARDSHGTFLVDGSGHALYVFAKDKRGKSMCDGTCASFWPPVQVHGSSKAGGPVKAGELGGVKRSDGTEQVTYNGHPLYYFSEDSKPGETKGQGRTDFGGRWSLVSPTGAAITGAAKGSSGSGGSGSGGSGSGGSGSSGSSGSGDSWG